MIAKILCPYCKRWTVRKKGEFVDSEYIRFPTCRCGRRTLLRYGALSKYQVKDKNDDKGY